MGIEPVVDIPRKKARKLLRKGIVGKLCTGIFDLEELRNQICDICVPREERKISPMIPKGPHVRCMIHRSTKFCVDPKSPPHPDSGECDPPSRRSVSAVALTSFRSLPPRTYDTWLYVTQIGAAISCGIN